MYCFLRYKFINLLACKCSFVLRFFICNNYHTQSQKLVSGAGQTNFKMYFLRIFFLCVLSWQKSKALWNQESSSKRGGWLGCQKLLFRRGRVKTKNGQLWFLSQFHFSCFFNFNICNKFVSFFGLFLHLKTIKNSP